MELLRGRDEHCVAPREVAQAKRIELEGQVSTVVHDRTAVLTRGDVFNRRDEALIGIHPLQLAADTEMDERARAHKEAAHALGTCDPLRIHLTLALDPERVAAHAIPVDNGGPVGRQEGAEGRRGVHADGDSVAGHAGLGHTA